MAFEHAFDEDVGMVLAHLAPATETPLDTPAEVLAAARLHQREAEAAEVRLLQACVQWCALHPVESLAESASWASFEKFGNVGVGLAGEGAPWVCEFAVVELAAALGKSAEAGGAYLGEAMELRYRLPKLWAKVTGGDLPVWRGRLVARATMPLTEKGARYVDTHVAAVAGNVGPAALERLVEEATVRFDPDEAERQRQLKAEARHVTVDLRQVSFDGHVEVAATLDLADALDLEDAVAKGAARLAALGCAESEGARRSMAVGEDVRHELVLELDTEPKPLTVHVHQRPDGTLDPVVRVEATRGFVLAGQLAEWFTRAARGQTGSGAQVTIKPVIDLADRIHVTAYEVPDRLAEQIRLRDHQCVFPLVHETRHRTFRHRQRPRHPLQAGRADRHREHRPAVQAPPPGQDPRRLAPLLTQPWFVSLDQPERDHLHRRLDGDRRPRRPPTTPVSHERLNPPPATPPRHASGGAPACPTHPPPAG